MSGLFIVLEGIDGSGKSSLCERIASVLNEEGYKARVTQEPTYDEVGSFIRSGTVKNISQKAEALLFVADRAIHTERITDWVNGGEIVICDRYFASTVAYQSSPLEGVALDREWLIALNSEIIAEPDITFLLDIDPEKSLRRTDDRGLVTKFEKADYLECVRENYLEIAEDYGFEIIDANLGKDEVFEAVMGKIRELL